MNNELSSNIKLSVIYGLSKLKKHINIGLTDRSVEIIQNKQIETELEDKSYVNSEKTNKILETIILSDNIINFDKSQINL
jgi:hypothetical protein